MKTIVLIGDAHGKMFQLQTIHKNIIRPDESSIQLGDMGCGFVKVPEFESRHQFIRGNHDDPAVALAHQNYLGDYGTLRLGGDKIGQEGGPVAFFISGADSIDKDMRVPGISWWEGEELGWQELQKAIDLYLETKPTIVLSHECPAEANSALLRHLMGDYFFAKAELRRSRTCQALQTMLEAHQPDLWVFGHYHINRQFKIGKTTFQCLGELETFRLDGDVGLSRESN